MIRYLSLLLILVIINRNCSVEVCRSFEEYGKNEFDDCWQSDEVDLNVTQIIRSWGCNAIEYNVTTSDGYNLLMVRAFKNVKRSSRIVLGHGIYTNSLAFVYRNNKSIAYNLIFSGYEIFLLNFRGTVYSSHVNFTKDDREFWNYSVHEMGTIDLPTFSNEIFRILKKKFIYFGYSMGTTASFIYSSRFPSEANKMFQGMIQMAPVTTLKFTKSIIGWLVNFWDQLLDVFDSEWNGKILLPKNEFNKFCATSSTHLIICEIFRTPAVGEDIGNLDPVQLYFKIQYLLALDAISTKNIDHYTQMILNERFQQFDYGREKNLELYGTSQPPLYNYYTNVKIPIIIIQGKNDWLASSKNSKWIYKKINKNYRCGFYYVPWDKFNHFDFVTGNNSPEKLNPLIISIVQRIENNVCFKLSHQ